jgi:hypothetical protein
MQIVFAAVLVPLALAVLFLAWSCLNAAYHLAVLPSYNLAGAIFGILVFTISLAALLVLAAATAAPAGIVVLCAVGTVAGSAFLGTLGLASRARRDVDALSAR